MDRYSALRRSAQELGVDGIALVPGPNFERIYDKAFHSHERPLLRACEPVGENADDLNSIPEEVSGL